MNRKSTMDELNRLDVEQFRAAPKIPIILVLDDVRSMQNVGSIFRTADAFRIAHIHLCGISPCPPHRDIRKTALGATESVDWSYEKSAISVCNTLKDNGYAILSLEQTTASINLSTWSISKSEKLALVIGNEVQGVSEELIELSDHCLEIEQFGTKHSLNVAVSTGIALHHLSHQLRYLIN